MKEPVIGLTLDWREGGENKYSRYPWYALRENYSSAVADAGGLPLFLPFHLDHVDNYLDKVDGIIVTGGDFDVDPSLYGETARHDNVISIPHRTTFEFEIVRKALERNIPVLGICGGHQLINVVLGGTLVQDIEKEWPNALQHQQEHSRHESAHSISIAANTLLRKIVGVDMAEVNSVHHQAVKTPGKGVVVNAMAPDGIIEGIEHPGYKFCMGIQWHPEFIISDVDKGIFEAFIAAAAQ